MPTNWRAELRQAVTIARATFGGFLQSDVMPQGMQASATIWAAAFLAAPAMLLSSQFLGGSIDLACPQRPLRHGERLDHRFLHSPDPSPKLAPCPGLRPWSGRE